MSRSLVRCSWLVAHEVAEKLALVAPHTLSSVAPDGDPDHWQVLRLDIATDDYTIAPHPGFPAVTKRTTQEAFETFYNELPQAEKDKFIRPS